MKLRKVLSMITPVAVLSAVMVPLCSCVGETKQQNLAQQINSNLTENKSDPKKPFDIDKVIKIKDSSGNIKIYQNVYRPYIPNTSRNVSTIPSNTFQGNKTIEHIGFTVTTSQEEPNLTSIGKGAFQACSSLETIDLPAKCTTIGERAFFRCSKLSYINLASLTTVAELEALAANIGAHAFEGVAAEGEVVFDTTLVSTTAGKAAAKKVVERLHNSEVGLPSAWNNNAVRKWNWDWDKSKETEQWNELITTAENGSDALYNLFEGETDLVGKIASVTVNNQQHAVRIIGMDHDDLSDGTGKAALTFEFANLISDSNGYSINTFWNNTATINGSNNDYMNSTIRTMLNSESELTTTDTAYGWWYAQDEGTGDDTELAVPQPTKATSSQGDYYNKSVYLMLPDTLRTNIKSVQKWVNYNDGTTSTSGGANFNEISYNDKLFFPTVYEQGYDNKYAEGPAAISAYHSGGTTNVSMYDYYTSSTSSTDAKRIKKQVKGDTAITGKTYDVITDAKYTSLNCNNYAGYNYAADATGGGNCWLASPSTLNSRNAWYCYIDGHLSYNNVYNYAYGVAPCFCIGKTTNFDKVSWDMIGTAATNLEDGAISETDFCNKFKIKDLNTESETYGQYITPSKLTDFVGQTRTVTVNSQPHTVRVVGTSGEDSSIYQVNKIAGTEKSAALTFEFANLISDSNGKSLACQYKDTTETSWSSNQNYYANSTLRMNLVGVTDAAEAATVTWFGVGDTSYATNETHSDYYNKTVWAMLPSSLTADGIIKTTSRTYTGKDSECTCSDKLFLPAGEELGYATSGSQLPYYYYKDCTSQTDATRIKTQVVRDSNTTYKSSCASKVKTSGVLNYAGYDNESSGYGGRCWLASPYAYISSYAWYCDSVGRLYDYDVYSDAYGVAPCFCI